MDTGDDLCSRDGGHFVRSVLSPSESVSFQPSRRGSTERKDRRLTVLVMAVASVPVRITTSAASFPKERTCRSPKKAAGWFPVVSPSLFPHLIGGDIAAKSVWRTELSYILNMKVRWVQHTDRWNLLSQREWYDRRSIFAGRREHVWRPSTFHNAKAPRMAQDAVIVESMRPGHPSVYRQVRYMTWCLRT